MRLCSKNWNKSVAVQNSLSQPLPRDFVENLETELGPEESAALMDALSNPSTVSVRCHPLKNAGRYMDCTQIPWSRNGRRLPSRPVFTLDPYFHAGSYYPQDASSQFMDYLSDLFIKPGDKVLDMCAAPGGKATIYSEHVGRAGLVVANEYVRSRAMVLADNVCRWGMGNTVVTSCDSSLFGALSGFFDIVAVDAPCSGEGMFRKEADAVANWNLDYVRECAARQKEILSRSFKALREGGLLIYSTCTFNRQENEQVLQHFEREYASELEPVSIELPLEWGILSFACGSFTVFRMFPHHVEGEGLFVAVARRKSAPAKRSLCHRRKVTQSVTKTEREILSQWLSNEKNSIFLKIAESFYALDEECVNDIENVISVCPSLYAGVRMGEIFKNALKPSWALSQYCERRPDVTQEIQLDTQLALEYLRRHDVALENAAQGICLLKYGDVALGYAKKIGKRTNNMYPNSLRIQNL